MRSARGSLALALVGGLVLAGSAQAAMIAASITLPPHAKGVTGPGNAVQVTFRWQKPSYLPPSATDKQDITATSLDGGVSTSAALGPANESVPLLLSNGRLYNINLAACQTNAVCTTLPFDQHIDVTAQTRIDATPPAGTVQIDGGAQFTNSREVSLGLVAADPLIDGIAGSSSGVTQFAVDGDGDGAYPCSILFDGDRSGCARTFGAEVPATLTSPGDGPKLLGVKFGDGARDVRVPCVGVFCVVFLGSPIAGNESLPAVDSILLDTVRPTATAALDRTTVDRGQSVTFDASGADPGGANASGVDASTATWTFNDGSAAATGARVTHAYASAGTFVGEVRVRDRAGNLSDPRSFTVTVNPAASAAGGGSIGAVQGRAALAITRLRVRARYVRSALRGTVEIRGVASQAGPLTQGLRTRSGARLLLRTRSQLAVGPFTRTLRLPRTLLPGRYRLAYAGPGGTLTTTLRLVAPREGVLRRARVVRARGSARAVFTFAALPARALRGRLSVAWSQGGRGLGRVPVRSRRTVSVPLPAGAALRAGTLRAQLRAGSRVVGTARPALR